MSPAPLHTLFHNSLRPEFIQGWLNRGIDSLLPFQLEALTAIQNKFSPSPQFSSSDPFHPSTLSPPPPPSTSPNVLILAPTSSGKTLIAELALALHLNARRKAIYLVPTRALAEEKFAAFQTWLAPAGLRVACATRERPETDRLVATGRFDLLVAVYEKFDQYLKLRRPPNYGVLVVDELQTIGDPERGAMLDLLLTKIKSSPTPPQIIALASNIPESSARELAAWLNAELLISRDRPRELREGVLDLSSGIFRFMRAGDSLASEESLAATSDLNSIQEDLASLSPDSETQSSEVLSVLTAAADRFEKGESLLLFAPTRSASAIWACRLADLFAPSQINDPLSESIRRAEPCRMMRLLAHCAERGVAFHNADLPEPLRGAVEEAFNSGAIRAVVSTSTLGTGLNLSAQNVIQFPWTIACNADAGTHECVSLPRSKFSNHGGRAARLGCGDGFGRSMLVANDSAEADRLFRQIILSPLEPLVPQIHQPLEPSVILNLLSASKSQSSSELHSTLSSTYAASRCEGIPTSESAPPPGNAGILPASREETLTLDSIESTLHLCESEHLVRRTLTKDKIEKWKLTGLGEAVAASGISLETAKSLRRELKSSENLLTQFNLSKNSADIFFALASTIEIHRLALTSSILPELPLFKNSFDETADETDESPAPSFDPSTSPRIHEILNRPGGPTRDELVAIRVALLLEDWITDLPASQLEDKYQILHGSILRIASEASRLLRAFSAIAAALRQPPRMITSLRSLAAHLDHRSEKNLKSAIHCVLPGSAGVPPAPKPRTSESPNSQTALPGNAGILPASKPRTSESPNTQAALPGNAGILPASKPRTSESPNSQTALPGNAGILPASKPRTSESPNTQAALPGNAGILPASKPRTSESPDTQAALPGNAGILPASDRPTPQTNPAPLLEIRLTSPGIILARGAEVRLTPLSFDLLAALAERPGEVVTREALYHRLWADEGPEDQQLDDHRRRLIQKLKPQLGESAHRVAEVVRGIGFRFAHPPGSVRLRRD